MLQDLCHYHILTRYQMGEMVMQWLRAGTKRILIVNFTKSCEICRYKFSMACQRFLITRYSSFWFYSVQTAAFCVRYWHRAWASNCQTCQVDHGLMQLDLLYLLYPIGRKAFINLKSFPTPMLGSIQQFTLQKLNYQA